MEKCVNCKYFKELKIYDRYIKTLGGHGVVSGWKVAQNLLKMSNSKCCIALLEKGIVLETTEKDICELYKNKKDN